MLDSYGSSSRGQEAARSSRHTTRREAVDDGSLLAMGAYADLDLCDHVDRGDMPSLLDAKDGSDMG